MTYFLDKKQVPTASFVESASYATTASYVEGVDGKIKLTSGDPAAGYLNNKLILPKSPYFSYVVGFDSVDGGNKHTYSVNTSSFILPIKDIYNAEAISLESNGNLIDGQRYRILDPSSPLYSVTLLAVKDAANNVTFSHTGVGIISGSNLNIDVECWYDPGSGIINYIKDNILNIHLKGPDINYADFPWGNDNYHDLNFTDLVYNINQYDSCSIRHSIGIGSNITLYNSSINGVEFGYGASINISGSDKDDSYVNETKILPGASVTLYPDTTIEKSHIGRGFTVRNTDGPGNQRSFNAVGCWLENFELEVINTTFTFTNCTFGGAYSHYITRDFTNVDFSRGYLELIGKVQYNGTDSPTVVILQNDLQVTELTHIAQGPGCCILNFDLVGGSWPEEKIITNIENMVISIGAGDPDIAILSIQHDHASSYGTVIIKSQIPKETSFDFYNEGTRTYVGFSVCRYLDAIPV